MTVLMNFPEINCFCFTATKGIQRRITIFNERSVVVHWELHLSGRQ